MPTEESSQDAPGTRVWTRKTDGVTTYGPVTQKSGLHSKSYQRVVKPDRRPKPAGWLFPRPYEFEKEQTQYCVGKMRRRFPGYDDFYRGQVSQYLTGTSGGNLMPGGNNAKGTSLPTLGRLSLAETKALNGLLTDGKARESVLSIGVAWRERNETASMLDDAAAKLVKWADDLRHGRPIKAFREMFPNGSRKDFRKLKGTPYWKWYTQMMRERHLRLVLAAPVLVASAILALQNGWMPLLSDIHAAAETLAYRDDPADWLITSKGYVKDVEVIRELETPVNQPGNELVHESVITKACFVRLDVTVIDFVAHQWAQLGLNNPASLLYETTPLTYVADFFWDVGNWLSAMGAASGMKFYSGSTTRYGEVVTLIRDNGKDPESRFRGQRRWVKMERKVLSNFPIPVSPFELHRKPLSLRRLSNLLALFSLYVTGQPIRDLRQ